jgi:hypothetical protein
MQLIRSPVRLFWHVNAVAAGDRVGDIPFLTDKKVPVSGERNNMRVHGEPHNSPRSTFPADGVNGRDEFTECECLLPVIGFHDVLAFRSGVAIVWASASNQ